MVVHDATFAASPESSIVTTDAVPFLPSPDRHLASEGALDHLYHDSTPYTRARYFVKQRFEHLWTVDNLLLLLVVLLTVITGTANNVLFYKISLPMANYPIFLAVFATFFSIPIYWLIVAVIMLVPRWRDLITPEMLGFCWYKLAALGLLDALQGILMFLADSHVEGAMQQLLTQLVIPCSMILSLLFLGTSYTIGQYSGAALICIACVLDVIPAFEADQSSSGSGNSPYWIFVFIAGTVPFAVSMVYKEVVFRDIKMSIFYLMAADASYQLICTLILTPVDAIPKIGSSSSLEDVYVNMWDGCKCMFGYNSLSGDDCNGVWLLLLQYVLFNIAINLCLLYLIQRGSAAFMFLAMTITVPTANLCFTFTFIMGSAAQPLSIWDIIALVLIVIGLLMYRFFSPPAEPDHLSTDKWHHDLDYNTTVQGISSR